MKRLLLGQLGSNGDCLYATAIARQLKAQCPTCHLTWAVGQLSRQVLVNNPDVDDVWELPQTSWTEYERSWNLFEIEAHQLADAGRFDNIYLTQISPARFGNYDGTIRPSIFRNFRMPISEPVDVTITLTEEEEVEVDRWFADGPAADASQVVLCECSSKSGQSFMTTELAVQIAERITAERKKTVVIISTQESIQCGNPRIINGGALSIRQTARLTHYVDLFIGCGAALTVAATSGAAKPHLPNIQVLKRDTSVYASFRHDFEYFGKPTHQFLEITSENLEYIAEAALAVLAHGFPAAKADYDEPVPLSFGWYRQLVSMMLIEKGRYLDAMNSVFVTTERYGWNRELISFAKYRILPFLTDDPRYALPHRREQIERIREAVQTPLICQ